MVGAYGVGELLQTALAADHAGWRPGLRRAAEYFAIAAACLSASLVNPYTYHLHLHVWAYLRDPYLSQHIMEFMSLSFQHPLAPFLEAILLGGALASAWCVSEGRYTEPLLYLIWAHEALAASRNIPICMILTVPMVAEAAHAAFQRLPQRHVAGWLRALAARLNRTVADTCETDALPRWYAVSAAGVLLLAALLWAHNPPKRFRAEFDPQAFPAGAMSVSHRPGFRGRPLRLLWRRFREKGVRRRKRELRMGQDAGAVRRQYDFDAPQLASDGRAQRIQPVAGGI
jgi:hypothetical protein